MFGIQPGATVSVAGDLIMDGVLVFGGGDRVVIEQVCPNPDAPEYKYMVVSPRTRAWLQLRDVDIETPSVPQIPVPQPQAYAGQMPTAMPQQRQKRQSRPPKGRPPAGRLRH